MKKLKWLGLLLTLTLLSGGIGYWYVVKRTSEMVESFKTGTIETTFISYAHPTVRHQLPSICPAQADGNLFHAFFGAHLLAKDEPAGHHCQCHRAGGVYLLPGPGRPVAV